MLLLEGKVILMVCFFFFGFILMVCFRTNNNLPPKICFERGVVDDWM